MQLFTPYHSIHTYVPRRDRLLISKSFRTFVFPFCNVFVKYNVYRSYILFEEVLELYTELKPYYLDKLLVDPNSSFKLYLLHPSLRDFSVCFWKLSTRVCGFRGYKVLHLTHHSQIYAAQAIIPVSCKTWKYETC